MENGERTMGTIGALDDEWDDSCVDPTWLNVKVLAQKGCNDRLMQ